MIPKLREDVGVYRPNHISLDACLRLQRIFCMQTRLHYTQFAVAARKIGTWMSCVCVCLYSFDCRFLELQTAVGICVSERGDSIEGALTDSCHFSLDVWENDDFVVTVDCCVTVEWIFVFK